MTISVGATLPDAQLLRMGQDGPETVGLADMIGSSKSVIFGLPGAFTGVCSTAHLPSFIKSRGALADQGIEHVICVTVNDPFVVAAWDAASGASDANVAILGDADAAFTKSLGLDFTAPPVGLIDRSQRYVMVIEDGKVTHLEIEASPGECTVSSAESLLAAL